MRTAEQDKVITLALTPHEEEEQADETAEAAEIAENGENGCRGCRRDRQCDRYSRRTGSQ